MVVHLLYGALDAGSHYALNQLRPAIVSCISATEIGNFLSLYCCSLLQFCYDLRLVGTRLQVEGDEGSYQATW